MILFFDKTSSRTNEECQKNVKEVSTIVKSHEIVCYLQQLWAKEHFIYWES